MAHYGGGWDDDKMKRYGIALLVATVGVLIDAWAWMD